MSDANLNATGVPAEGVIATQAVEPAPKKNKKPLKGDPELKDYNNDAAKRSRDKKKEKQKRKDGRFNSFSELTKSEALEVLSERVSNAHVRSVVFELGLAAAAKHGLVPNHFFWKNGLGSTLKSRQEKKEHLLTIDPKLEIPTEIIFAGDAYCIWDYSISYLEPGTTFEKFIETRKLLKSDWFEIAKFIGMPVEETHRKWQEFLPNFKPTLRPAYTLPDMRQWLKTVESPTFPGARDFLLMGPRGSMKSSTGIIFLAQALLCCPSLRLLLVSEVSEMAKRFVKGFRSLWELDGDPAYARFQSFFPEFCIKSGEGTAKSFTSPMRTLAVREETAFILSLDMAAQSLRFDLAWLDDCVGKTNTLNDEQRGKVTETYGAVLKLRETGAGLTVTCGTPWVPPPPGGVGDLYWELMKRNSNSPEPWLAVRIDPAWVLKPEFEHLFPDKVNELNEAHVESLAFPERMPFRDLMAELRRSSVQEFESQFLCRYVESEEHKWLPTFTLEELEAKVRPLDFFGEGRAVSTVCAVDTANSEAIGADLSSICIARIFEHEGKSVAFVVETIAGQWRYSKLAERFVEACEKYGIKQAVIERNNIPYLDFQAAVQRNALLRGVVLPDIQWNLSTGTGMTGVSAKTKRIKGAEVAVDNGQVYFAYGPSWDGLFHELTRFKGQRSGSSLKSKDDRADSLGLLVQKFLIRDTGEVEKTPEQFEMEAQAEAQRLVRMAKDFYFGSPVPPSQQIYIPPADGELPDHPFDRAGFKRFGFTRAA